MATKLPTQLPADSDKRMDQGFAVFNCHINNARVRATAEFIAQFGQERYDRHIGKYDDGIMALFNVSPNKYQLVWVSLVTAFVNEDRKTVYALS